jgi:hypothetical protein
MTKPLTAARQRAAIKDRLRDIQGQNRLCLLNLAAGKRAAKRLGQILAHLPPQTPRQLRRRSRRAANGARRTANPPIIQSSNAPSSAQPLSKEIETTTTPPMGARP